MRGKEGREKKDVREGQKESRRESKPGRVHRALF
jgi:hypothetical protein